VSNAFHFLPQHNSTVSLQTFQRNGEYRFGKIVGETHSLSNACKNLTLLPVSQFIKLLTGDENIVIGHNIDSETIDVMPYILYDQNSDRKVVLVDTPGFDDSRLDVSDTEILRRIADFLVNEYVDFDF
jgi:hypothetical protein